MIFHIRYITKEGFSETRKIRIREANEEPSHYTLFQLEKNIIANNVYLFEKNTMNTAYAY